MASVRKVPRVRSSVMSHASTELLGLLSPDEQRGVGAG